VLLSFKDGSNKDKIEAIRTIADKDKRNEAKAKLNSLKIQNENLMKYIKSERNKSIFKKVGVTALIGGLVVLLGNLFIPPQFINSITNFIGDGINSLRDLINKAFNLNSLPKDLPKDLPKEVPIVQPKEVPFVSPNATVRAMDKLTKENPIYGIKLSKDSIDNFNNFGMP